MKHRRRNFIIAEDSKETLDSFRVCTATTYSKIPSTENNFSMSRFKFHQVSFVKTSFWMMIQMIVTTVLNLI
jgi:hypothetical protein